MSNKGKVYRISVKKGHVTMKEFYTRDLNNVAKMIDILNHKYIPNIKHSTCDYMIITEVYDDTSATSIDHTYDYGYGMIVTLNGELEPIAFHINNVIPWELKDSTDLIVDVSHRVPDIYYVKLTVFASNANAAIERAKHLIAKELPMIENW